MQSAEEGRGSPPEAGDQQQQLNCTPAQGAGVPEPKGTSNWQVKNFAESKLTERSVLLSKVPFPLPSPTH